MFSVYGKFNLFKWDRDWGSIPPSPLATRLKIYRLSHKKLRKYNTLQWNSSVILEIDYV